MFWSGGRFHPMSVTAHCVNVQKKQKPILEYSEPHLCIVQFFWVLEEILKYLILISFTEEEAFLLGLESLKITAVVWQKEHSFSHSIAFWPARPSAVVRTAWGALGAVIIIFASTPTNVTTNNSKCKYLLWKKTQRTSFTSPLYLSTHTITAV